MNRNQTRWIALAGAVAALALLIWQPWKSSATPKPPGPGNLPPPTVVRLPVSVQILSPGFLANEITVSGALEAAEEIDLASEIAGKVLKIYFAEGVEVAEGQLLVKLQDDDLRANLQKLTLQLDLARQLEQRRQRLLDIGGVSQEEYDQALTALRTAEAELALLQVNLSKTEIRAPFSGRIGFRSIGEGSYLSPGMQIARLVRLDPIHVRFSVPEKYGYRIRGGELVRFQLEGKAEPGQAAVFAKAPGIDPVTRTLEIKARAANRARTWTPGAFAQVTVRLSEENEALLLRPIAVISEIGGQSVFLYKNGIARITQIKTGVRSAETVQVIHGLQLGDTVIVSGVLQLRDGAPVAISEVLH